MRPRAVSRLVFLTAGSLAVGILFGMYLPAPTGRAAQAGDAPVAVSARGRQSGSPAPSARSGLTAARSTPAATSPARPSPKPARTASPRPSAIPAGGALDVPILYYHCVRPIPAGYTSWTVDQQRSYLQYSVLPSAFTAQLDWLRNHGYTTILPRDLVAYWDRGKPLPAKPVILTFDDGSPDWVTVVLPALQARGMVAEFYVVIANVGKGFTWADVRTLADAGMGIGSHDVHHVQLTALGAGVAPASAETMAYEVTESRRVIHANVGVYPDSLAYVGGGFDATLATIVADAGYTSARAIVRGISQSSEDRFQLRVVRIGAYDDVRSVLTEELVAGMPTFTRRVTGVDPG